MMLLLTFDYTNSSDSKSWKLNKENAVLCCFYVGLSALYWVLSYYYNFKS